ncbi:MAG: F0F1 ATP synthase subunit epsilon [Bdellovibrio sp. CG10_big_fil_rev_8_21_14_0_10_47_8]|nr:MAG: F0F1 ATP synthase subunit epsilon [Bdellovibrio sp. CG10_big_fil_rev_8_21_14_0_10_47_8]
MAFINLKILLPFKIFCQIPEVSRIVTETSVGSIGILPHRLDCVAALKPGILTYEKQGQETYVALDQGVLVKTGLDVVVSVRNAISGVNLAELNRAVEKEFLKLSELEQSNRQVMTKMENSLVRRFVEFHHE